jgi:hypothetical protein
MLSWFSPQDINIIKISEIKTLGSVIFGGKENDDC